MVQFLAVTETGVQTGMVWYNDHTEETSKLVFAGDVSEIMGISDDELNEYEDLEDMEIDTRVHGNYSFSQEPIF